MSNGIIHTTISMNDFQGYGNGNRSELCKERAVPRSITNLDTRNPAVIGRANFQRHVEQHQERKRQFLEASNS